MSQNQEPYVGLAEDDSEFFSCHFLACNHVCIRAGFCRFTTNVTNKTAWARKWTYFPNTYSKGKIIHASKYHSVCGHSSSLRACAEQQQSCFSVCSQRVKHVVLRSSREHTTEQIIMIQNSIAFWTRAISPPSVYCPRTGRHWPVCVQDAFLHVYVTCPFYIWGAILTALCFHTLQHYQHLYLHFMTYHTHTQIFLYELMKALKIL